MYDSTNIFAKIIRKEVPSKLIYEDEHLIAFNDLYPATPVHVLVIPKGEYINYTDFVSHATPELQLHFFKKTSELAKELCGEHFRLCTNNGEMSGQTIFHFHMHIMGGTKLGGF